MNHFHFGSARAAATVSFYEKYFGFRKIKNLGKTHVLKDQRNFILAIDEENEASPIPQSAHLGFTLSDPESVQLLYESLASDEVPLPGPLKKTSPRAVHFYCVDPSNNRVEVGWYDW
jgi:catechol 2,3-dioxygenase-like lactoylglutathione lyase family enzyme